MPCLRRMTTGLQPWETSRAQSVVRLSSLSVVLPAASTPSSE